MNIDIDRKIDREKRKGYVYKGRWLLDGYWLVLVPWVKFSQ